MNQPPSHALPQGARPIGRPGHRPAPQIGSSAVFFTSSITA